jgi:hypothetical protein
MRTSLTVFRDGSASSVSLEMTIRLTDSRYLMMLLLCEKRAICRLCMTTAHWERTSKTLITEGHFHSWEANRGFRNIIPKTLNRLEIVPSEIVGRDAAFVWFLERNGIEPVSWTGSMWPVGQGML